MDQVPVFQTHIADKQKKKRYALEHIASLHAASSRRRLDRRLLCEALLYVCNRLVPFPLISVQWPTRNLSGPVQTQHIIGCAAYKLAAKLKL